MNEYMIMNVGLDLSYAVIALFVLVLVLRFMDKRNGVVWKDVMEVIKSNALATAIYYGARFVGACILISAFVGL